MKTGVAKPDLYDPKINRAYAELGAHYGLLIDPARVFKPKDKARVERPMPYVRDSFWRGRQFTSLAQMQTEALRLVHRIVKDHGETLQYSVFLCDLAPQELTGLKWRLGQAMAHDVDSILVLDLGDPGDLSAFTFLGERSDLPTSGPTIL